MQKQDLFTPEQKKVVVGKHYEFGLYFSTKNWLTNWGKYQNRASFKVRLENPIIINASAQLGILFAYHIATKNYEYFIQNRKNHFDQYFSKKPNVEVLKLYCNNPEAGVLKRNRINSLEKLIFNNDELNSEKILIDLENLSPDLIVLAGFLKKIPEKIIDLFRNKIVNIHPSLLPKYGGKGMFGINVHKAVIENNEQCSGFTIHYVNKNYDEGDIIFQKKIRINTKSPENLAKKILVEEHKFYPQIIENILDES